MGVIIISRRLGLLLALCEGGWEQVHALVFYGFEQEWIHEAKFSALLQQSPIWCSG